MEENKTIDLVKIEGEFEKQVQELRESIDRVGIRQDELRGYIVDVTEMISQIKVMLENLPKEAYEAKAKLHIAIQKNNELIAKFYDAISNFESVRHRYQQEIGKTTKDKIQFLNIDIRRVEDKLENTSAGMTKFMKELRGLVTAISNTPEVAKITENIASKPEYSME